MFPFRAVFWSVLTSVSGTLFLFGLKKLALKVLSIGKEPPLGFAAAYGLRGRIYGSLEHHELALAEYLKYIKARRLRSPHQKDDPHDLIAISRVLVKLGKPQLAENLLNSVLGPPANRSKRADEDASADDLTKPRFFPTDKWRRAFEEPEIFKRMSRQRRANFIALIKSVRPVIPPRFSSSMQFGPGAVFKQLGDAVDICYANIVVIRALILNNALKLSKTDPSQIFIPLGRATAMILGHITIFYLTSRTMPRGLSFFTFTAPAFVTWLMFTIGMNKSESPEGDWPHFYSRKVRWISFVLATVSWEFISMVFAFTITYASLRIFDWRGLLGAVDFTHLPDFIGLVFIAYAFGIAFGGIVHGVAEVFPAMKGAVHMALPFLFVTSGVYEAYPDLPSAAQSVVWYNPMATLVENSRHMFSPFYNLSNLTLWYPVTIAVIGIFYTMLAHNAKFKRV